MNFQKLDLPQKPVRKILSTEIDYFQLFDLIEQKYDSCYLLESLHLAKQQDRYVTLGFDPDLVISARKKTLNFQGDLINIQRIFPKAKKSEIDLEVENPYFFLREIFPNSTLSKTREGGLLGYFSYETINYFEPTLDLPEDPDFGQFSLGLYTDGLIYDLVTGTLEYYFYFQDRSQEIFNLINELQESKSKSQINSKLDNVSYLGDSSSEKEHSLAVQNSLEEIQKGNSFQIEVGFKSYYEIKGRKKIVYDALREVNPSPYMFYFKFGDIICFGSSPEILLSITDSEVITRPAAGTINRGKDLAEDQMLSRTLLNDPKEIAEHNMLVDLHRNDLGRICQFGTVKVRDLMYLIKFSHVQHIVSDIVGILKPEVDSFEALASILPGGVLTGAPKLETIKIIQKNEQKPRGPYGGAAGRFSFNQDLAFCLPIRSLFCKGDKCFTQTSSGVVLDSTPKNEYLEVKRKSQALRLVLESLT